MYVQVSQLEEEASEMFERCSGLEDDLGAAQAQAHLHAQALAAAQAELEVYTAACVIWINVIMSSSFQCQRISLKCFGDVLKSHPPLPFQESVKTLADCGTAAMQSSCIQPMRAGSADQADRDTVSRARKGWGR